MKKTFLCQLMALWGVLAYGQSLPQLATTSCNATNVSLQQSLTATPSPGASEYEFEVLKCDSIGGGEVDTLFFERLQRPVPNFKLEMLVNRVQGDQQYDVKVRAKTGNSFGSFGPACEITTSSQHMVQLVPGSCGEIITANQVLISEVEPGATQYTFEVRYPNFNNILGSVTNTTNSFTLSQLGIPLQDGAKYWIAVYVTVGGVEYMLGGFCPVVLEYNNSNCVFPTTCNFVDNGDFETFTNLPGDGFGTGIELACPWMDNSRRSFARNGNYIHAQSPNLNTQAPDPINRRNCGSLPPYNGEAYIKKWQGAHVWQQLNRPMTNGCRYYASMQVSTGCTNNVNFSDNIGMVFTEGLEVPEFRDFYPQAQVRRTGNNPVLAAGWTRVSGVFTANGNFDYVMLAPFHGSFTFAKLFYIDDIIAVELPKIQEDLFSSCAGQSVQMDATGCAPDAFVSYHWTDGANDFPGLTPTMNPLVSTQYTLIMVVDGEEVTVGTAMVNVIPVAQVSINASETCVQENPIQLCASFDQVVPPNANIVWTNELDVEVGTGVCYDVTTPGTYTVTYTSPNGCFSTDVLEVPSCCADEEDISVYPAQSYIYVNNSNSKLLLVVENNSLQDLVDFVVQTDIPAINFVTATASINSVPTAITINGQDITVPLIPAGAVVLISIRVDYDSPGFSHTVHFDWEVSGCFSGTTQRTFKVLIGCPGDLSEVEVICTDGTPTAANQTTTYYIHNAVPNVTSMSLDLSYDPAVVDFQQAILNTLVNFSGAPGTVANIVNNTATGDLSFTIHYSTPQLMQNTPFSLNFDVIGMPSEGCLSSISVTNAFYVQSGGLMIPAPSDPAIISFIGAACNCDNASLNADFTMTPNPALFNTIVNIAAVETNPAAYHNWKIGGALGQLLGNTSAFPTHIFNIPGTYEVEHTIFLNGMSKTAIDTIEVVCDTTATSCQYGFTWEVIDTCNAVVQFYGQFSTNAMEWNWDFGNGLILESINNEGIHGPTDPVVGSATMGGLIGGTYQNPVVAYDNNFPLPAGAYGINVSIVGLCCDSTGSGTQASDLHFGPAGHVAITSLSDPGQMYCTGTFLEFTASASNITAYDTFNWTTDLGIIVSGNGTNHITVEVTNPLGGQVCAETVDGCTTSTCIVIQTEECCANEGLYGLSTYNNISVSYRHINKNNFALPLADIGVAGENMAGAPTNIDYSAMDNEGAYYYLEGTTLYLLDKFQSTLNSRTINGNPKEPEIDNTTNSLWLINNGQLERYDKPVGVGLGATVPLTSHSLNGYEAAPGTSTIDELGGKYYFLIANGSASSNTIAEVDLTTGNINTIQVNDIDGANAQQAGNDYQDPEIYALEFNSGAQNPGSALIAIMRHTKEDRRTIEQGGPGDVLNPGGPGEIIPGGNGNNNGGTQSDDVLNPGGNPNPPSYYIGEDVVRINSNSGAAHVVVENVMRDAFTSSTIDASTQYYYFTANGGQLLYTIDVVNATKVIQSSGLPNDPKEGDAYYEIEYLGCVLENRMAIQEGALHVIDAETMMLSIYPNPTSGEFTVVWESSYPQTVVEVIDLFGKQVLIQQTSANKMELDLSSFAKGVYLVRILRGNQVSMEKVIVE